jgi:hypothetical protein
MVEVALTICEVTKMSTENVCPECGKLGRCEHGGDVGAGEEYYDHYVFTCPCGYTDTKDVFGGRMSQDNGPTTCPFCGE